MQWSPPVAARGELLKAFSVQVEAETLRRQLLHSDALSTGVAFRSPNGSGFRHIAATVAVDS
jgi:hypothetical protein